MSKDESLDRKTRNQVHGINQRHARQELERRSKQSASIDHGYDVINQIQKLQTPDDNLTTTERQLANSEETIVRLLNQSSTFNRVIEKLVEAWGPKDQAYANEQVDKLIEKVGNDITSNESYQESVRNWAKQQIKEGTSVSKPKLQRAPKR